MPSDSHKMMVEGDFRSLQEMVEYLRPVILDTESVWWKTANVAMKAAKTKPITVLQYWDTDPPPDEVVAGYNKWNEAVEGVSGLRIARYTRATALAWMRRNTPELVGCF